MKRVLLCVLALGLAAAAPALAADRHPAGEGHPAMAHSAPRMHVNRPAARAAVRGPAMSHRAFRPAAHRTVHRGVRHTATRQARSVTHRAVHHAVHHAVRHAVHKAAAHNAHGRFAKVRRAVHASHRFHAGVYHRPRGWFARHWRLGQRLPRGWFVRDYWLTDWAVYGLWAPVDGLIWVRVGNDALLIDPDTGDVIGVEYGVFW